MLKNTAYIVLLIFLFLTGFWISTRTESKLIEVKKTQIMLGTVVEIKARDEDKEKAELTISKAFDEIKRIDNLFSAYNKESAVWKLNHSGLKVTDLPNELLDMIIFSDSMWKISNGAFDVSLGNLIELWGFSSDNPTVPDLNKLKEALNSSGWKNIRLDNSKQLSYNKKVKLDFGAVAKGYAVDKAVAIIKQNGIDAALVNAGGEVTGYGNKWIVGIQHPRNRNEMIGKIKLDGMSVATSGDYEQYFERNGKRYHHILDPKTGDPSDGCQSVTIISKENKTADALATAVFVMGPEKGMKLVENLSDVEAMIVDKNGKMMTSKNFDKFLLR